jgi:HTH-type transcriptional repressor of NAD biosynthesis genes
MTQTLHEDSCPQNGLVIGKFMPLHLGHMALINFAIRHCRHLTVAMVAKQTDPISVPLRLSWFKRLFGDQVTVKVVDLSEVNLPVTEAHTPEAEAVWTDYFRTHFAETDILFSSEAYGDTLAEALGIPHRMFDPERCTVPISGAKIRSNPKAAAEHLPDIVYQDLNKT